MSGVGDHDDLLATLRRNEHTLERFQRSHESLVAEISALTGQLESHRAELAAIKSSVRVQYGGILRDIAERMAPPRTFRRRLAALGLRVAKSASSANITAAAPGGIPNEVLALPRAEHPEVSIVIPAHNHWPTTLACLRSIADDRPATGYEVILVDDASSDETKQYSNCIGGLTIIRLEKNVGFTRAVNRGIEHARGDYVLLLNNDTRVRRGWLDALVATAESGSRIGVVGAKLIYPDGSLQEAGAIVWSDGTCHIYGRGADPDDFRFAFPRDVDYCSGACLLVRRDLLSAQGGLDVRYSPAYYEDTDLCFAARARGYRVVYQPKAAVEHIEGNSHGTDLSSGTKRFQGLNRAKFVNKWSEVLLEQPTSSLKELRRSSWRSVSGRALVMDYTYPKPDTDAGSKRMSEILKLLVDLGFAVTFVPHTDTDFPPYREALNNMGVEVLPGPRALRGYIDEVRTDLKLVVLSRPLVAWTHYPTIRTFAPDAQLVYDTVDLHHIREGRRSEANGDAEVAHQANYLYGMESSLVRLVDQVWAVSQPESEVLEKIDPTSNIVVVPTIHRGEPPGPGFELRKDLLFVGSFAHHPNLDAVEWLVATIFPQVRNELPGVNLAIVGSQPTPDILAMEGKGVIVHGWVPQLDELYNQSRIFVAPLRFGAGMKGKVGEACAFGLPVVTTAIGAEGMGLVQGESILIADTADEFVNSVVELYRNEELWGRLATHAKATVSKCFSPGPVRANLARSIKSLGVSVIESQ